MQFGKIERLSYARCLDELSKHGEKLKFGDDLSDAALRKLGEMHSGFLLYHGLATKAKALLYTRKGR